MNQKRINLGYLSANIAGDVRYTDTLFVDYVPETGSIVVAVFSGSPIGGMDSFAPSRASEQYRKEFAASDLKGIAAALKEVLGDSAFNFKKYGKPTKNLKWSNRAVGMSAANLKANVEAAVAA
jgi:hypothetical protein